MSRRNLKGPRLGPGPFPVREWLTAYTHGDINRHEQLNEWRQGADGWIQKAPKAYGRQTPYFLKARCLF